MRDLANRSEFIHIIRTEGDPPEKYLIRYTCRGVEGINGGNQPIFREQHDVTIYLHAEYPLKQPQLKWMTPIFHPNIHITGAVCIGAWWPAKTLDELLLTLGKAGGSAMADAEALGRLISMALRSGIPIMEIHRQLRGISSDRAVGLGPNKVLSVPDAVGIALERWYRDKQGVQQDLLANTLPPRATPVPRVEAVSAPVKGAEAQGQAEFIGGYDDAQAFMGTCPDCGSQLEYAEGCVKCHVCGFSECG